MELSKFALEITNFNLATFCVYLEANICIGGSQASGQVPGKAAGLSTDEQGPTWQVPHRGMMHPDLQRALHVG